MNYFMVGSSWLGPARPRDEDGGGGSPLDAVAQPPCCAALPRPPPHRRTKGWAKCRLVRDSEAESKRNRHGLNFKTLNRPCARDTVIPESQVKKQPRAVLRIAEVILHARAKAPGEWRVALLAIDVVKVSGE